MKTTVLIITLLINSLMGMSENESKTATLTIEFDVTKYDKGSLLLALYNSEDTYMKKAVKNAQVSVKDKKATVVLENIAIGSYGFSYFHDVNDDGKLNKNFLGIPKEPYGFSNGEKGAFGPPDFEDIKFELKQDTTLNVKIK